MQILIIFLVFISLQVNGQENNCFPWLKNYTTTINTLHQNSFSFNDNRFDNVKVVGFGEDTHGTAEFTYSAASLMIYLAEKHNFQNFFIENGFGETTCLNDYINCRQTDAKKILKEKISTWRYQTTEFLSLLDTLKEYNLKHPKKPIQIFGIEMHYPLMEAKKLNEYFSKCELPEISASFDKTLYQDVAESEKADLFIAYQKARKQILDKKEHLISKSSEIEYAYAVLYTNILGQYVTAINQTNEQMKHDLRDLYMEINLSSILENIGEDKKSLVWAHNAHIGNWVSNGIVDVLGHHLKRKYGDSYFNIATQFGTGEYLAFPSNANEAGWKLLPHKRKSIKKDTFTFCLASLADPNVFLDIKKIRENYNYKCEIIKPLTLMRGAGAQSYRTETVSVEVGSAFDAILFIEKSTAINLLK